MHVPSAKPRIANLFGGTHQRANAFEFRAKTVDFVIISHEQGLKVRLDSDRGVGDMPVRIGMGTSLRKRGSKHSSIRDRASETGVPSGRTARAVRNLLVEGPCKRHRKPQAEAGAQAPV